MSDKLTFSNNSYLASITVVTIGVLSGCEYCTPLLMTQLSIPVVRNIVQALSGAGRATAGLS